MASSRDEPRTTTLAHGFVRTVGDISTYTRPTMPLTQDLRFAVRVILKDRWFTAVAALALGLGIGVNTTVFTFVNAALARGLPSDKSHEIYYVASRTLPDCDPQAASYPDFLDWKAHTTPLA